MASPGYGEAAKEHRSQQRSRAAKRRSNLEKEELFRRRDDILQLATTANLTPVRAAYVEFLLSIKSCQHQTDFSKDVIKTYGGITKVGRESFCHSVLDGSLSLREHFVAARIFPLSLGQRAMDYIFGPSARYEINSPQNALLLPPVIKKRFDSHQIAIVPAEPDTPGLQEWKFFILDKSSLWNAAIFPSGMKFSELHGRKLVFPTGFRPRAGYLYFHYLMSMIVLFRSAKKTGEVRSKFPDTDWPELTKAWATHGSYLRDDMIRSFIKEVGRDLPEELKENALAHCVSLRSDDEVEEVVESLRNMGMESESEGESDDDDDE
ncbi:hypothetical protein MferCBS31731_007411 [Microsporum ferrugineum]